MSIGRILEEAFFSALETYVYSLLLKAKYGCKSRVSRMGRSAGDG
jgi:hypothetical protein